MSCEWWMLPDKPRAGIYKWITPGDAVLDKDHLVPLLIAITGFGGLC